MQLLRVTYWRQLTTISPFPGKTNSDLSVMGCKNRYKLFNESCIIEPTGVKKWKDKFPNETGAINSYTSTHKTQSTFIRFIFETFHLHLQKFWKESQSFGIPKKKIITVASWKVYSSLISGCVLSHSKNALYGHRLWTSLTSFLSVSMYNNVKRLSCICNM